jgi:glycogen phosphorylase
VTDLEKLRALEKVAQDESFQKRFRAIKAENKARLAAYLAKEHGGIELPPWMLFDVQIKRIHEYKRQLLNLLHVVRRYLDLKSGRAPRVPRVVLFGGKAASAYDMAKRIIHLANAVQATVNADAAASGHLRVMFVPNYRVSLAEKLIPAADLSEQISTAGQEASGTGNMKFSMNGALTIGTLDGANVEIRDAVGAENFFLFGLTVAEVEAKKAAGYVPAQIYDKEERLREVIDAIGMGVFSRDEPGRFRPIVDQLMREDRFLLFADYLSYLDAQAAVDELYLDPAKWTEKAILNVARMGRFSSDATIRDYARDIWGVPVD